MSKKIRASMITPYLNEPCIRCGSKKRIAKTWKETLITFNGKSIVEHSQIVCTNNICQVAFEKLLLEEAKKRDAARAIKEANDIARKANLVLRTGKTKVNKSRI